MAKTLLSRTNCIALCGISFMLLVLTAMFAMPHTSYALDNSSGLRVGVANVAGAQIGARDIAKADIKIENAVYTGSACCPEPEVTYGGAAVPKSCYTVTYENNEKAGTASAIVEGSGEYVGVKRVSFTIAPFDISKAKITISNCYYNGKYQTPKAYVIVGGKAIAWSETICYYSNRAIGKARAVLSGSSNYTGTKAVDFRILRVPVSKLTVCQIPVQDYKGKPLKPSIKLKYGGTVLKKGTDYRVSYSSNNAVGYGKIKIKGKKRFVGTRVVKFKIVKERLMLTGKKVVIYGDSLNDVKRNFGVYVQTFAQSRHAEEIVNRAVSGATMAAISNENDLAHQIAQDERAGTLGSYDYYFIAAGTNDYGMYRMLGDPTSAQANTVCGALNTFIAKINAAHIEATGKGAKIVVITPIGRATKAHKVDTQERSSSTGSSADDSASNAVVEPVYSIQQYRAAIARTAMRDGAVVINGTKLASVREMKKFANSHDGLHPTAKFAQSKMVPRLATRIDNRIAQLR